MADWKKILFEGSDFTVLNITASDIPSTTSVDVPVVTVNVVKFY